MDTMKTPQAVVLGCLLGMAILLPLLMLQQIRTALTGPAPEAPKLRTVATSSGAIVCPPCDMLFSKLEKNSRGTWEQRVHMQERGEPKSGTSFMFEWAGGLLLHACDYLNRSFGEGSCHVKLANNRRFHTLEKCSLSFEPSKAEKPGPCSCDDLAK